MTDTPVTPKPMADDDIAPPLAATSFKEASEHFEELAPTEATRSAEPVGSDESSRTSPEDVAAPQALKDRASKLGHQATDRVRGFAEEGKARAGSALDQVSQMLTDAAGTVDEKVGEQYGKYARDAADRVTAFSEGLKAKDVDQLVDDTREFVRKSPGVAIGAAAAIGFVIARLLTAGYDQRDAT